MGDKRQTVRTPALALQRGRAFRTLDAIRGLAALVVVLRHTGKFWGPVGFQESYLAVDIFFLMSGVVIVNAYERRLTSGLSALGFMKIRLIRLYPLYLVGFALGIVAAVAASLTEKAPIDAGAFAISIALGLLVLPSPQFFPFNIPSWSLFLELAVNAAYAAMIRMLNGAVLAAVAILSGGALTVFVTLDPTHCLNYGSEWRLYWVGVLRVLYAFTTGVMVARTYRRLAAPSLAGRPALAGAGFVLVLALTGALLTAGPPPAWRGAYDLACVLLVFPLLISVALIAEPPRWAAGAATFLGLISYAVYIVHAPLGRLATGVAKLVLHIDVAASAPLSGAILIVGLVAAAAALDRFYDTPVRTWLTKTVAARRLAAGVSPLSTPASPGPFDLASDRAPLDVEARGAGDARFGAGRVT